VENAARGLGSSRSETGKWVETSKGVWAYEVAKPAASVSTEVAALTARGAKDKKDAATAEAIAKALSDHQPAEVVLPLTFGDIFVQSPAVRWCLLHNCEVESLAVMRQLCSTFMRDVPRVINSKDWHSVQGVQQKAVHDILPTQSAGGRLARHHHGQRHGTAGPSDAAACQRYGFESRVQFYLD
jgi:hypothetical protein